MKTHNITVTATDGNSWKTQINGTHSSVVEYYLTNEFNIGRVEDHMVTVHSVTFSDGVRVTRCPNPAAVEVVIPDQEKTYSSLGDALDILDNNFS